MAQFACFDTAFHKTLPEKAYHYPLPAKYLQEGVQRYGFHGLSYASIVHELGPELMPRTVVAHLGNGASLAALRDGKSIDTSMGLTPTGGIPMSTRTGDLDPGVLLYIRRTEGLSGDELEDLLNHQSGLKALGGSNDMRELQKLADGGDAKAAVGDRYLLHRDRENDRGLCGFAWGDRDARFLPEASASTALRCAPGCVGS